MQRQQLSQRPDYFELNPESPLAQRLMFAGLSTRALSLKFLDSSSHGNHGVLTNMPMSAWKYRTDWNRHALTFGGKNSDDYVLLDRDISFADGQPWSMSLWLDWFSDESVTAGNSIFGHAYESGSYSRCYYWSGTSQWRFINDANQWVSLTIGVIPIGEAHHYVLTRDSAAAFTLYRDGVSVDTPGSRSGIYTWRMIGGRGSTASPTSFNGDIADFMLYDRVLSVAEIQQLADPGNVMLSGLISPPRRRSLIAGGGAAAGTIIDCTLGTVAVSGLQSTINAEVNVDCTLATISVAGLQADVFTSTDIACSLGTVAVSGLQAGIQADTTFTCTLGTIAVTGLPAAVSTGTTIDCTVGTVTVAGLQASIQADTSFTCTLGTVSVTGLQAFVSVGTNVNCTLGTVAVAGLQASIQADTTFTCTLGTVGVTGLPATIGVGTVIDCALGTVTATGLQATIGQGTTIDCTIGAVTVSGLSAAIEAAVTIPCTLGAVTVAGLPASIQIAVSAVSRRTFDAKSDGRVFDASQPRTWNA